MGIISQEARQAVLKLGARQGLSSGEQSAQFQLKLPNNEKDAIYSIQLRVELAAFCMFRKGSGYRHNGQFTHGFSNTRG